MPTGPVMWPKQLPGERSSADEAFCQPDLEGELSIVVQGGLHADTAVEIARNLGHWRALFPAAEIVLALSGSSVLADPPIGGDKLDRLVLASPARHDSTLLAATAAIEAACDAMMLAAQALPMPPIKADTERPNNINLQVAAARIGLRQATGRWVLRVRADLVFLSRDFLTQYAAAAGLPRGSASRLGQRVLISWLYTLDPWGGERLPLHFSDWFHFGLLADVRRLWPDAPLGFADAIHHRTLPHHAMTNAAERLFNVRLADEQHLALAALASIHSGLALRHLADPQTADLSCQILADDFVLCDLAAARCLLPRYAAEPFNHRKLTACLTPADWLTLVTNRHVPPRLVLSGKRTDGGDGRARELRRGFPRSYPPSGYEVDAALVAAGEVSAGAPDGLLFRQAGIVLPPGRFVAHVPLTWLAGPGTLTATVTSGECELGQAKLGAAAWQMGEKLRVPFTIKSPWDEPVTVSCMLANLNGANAGTLMIAPEQPSPLDAPLPRRRALVPAADGSTLISEGDALRPGRYVAALNAAPVAAATTVVLAAVNGSDGAVLAECHARLMPGETPPTLAFTIADGPLDKLRIRCRSEEAGLAPDAVLLAEAADGEDALGFYDVLRLRARAGRFDGEGRIIATTRRGLVSYGPYVTLPRGSYLAKLHVAEAAARGAVDLTVTAGSGRAVLARTSHPIRSPGARRLAVPFAVRDAFVNDIELTCTVRGLASFALTGVTFLALAEGPPPARRRRANWLRRRFTARPLT